MRHCKAALALLVVVLAFACVASAADAPTLTFKFKYPVNIPKAYQTEPFGVNDAGVTSGTYWDNSSQYHGFILKGKNVTKLDDPNGAAGTTSGGGLNPEGAISVVGYYTSSKTGNAVGFLYNAASKTYTDIPGPSEAVQTYPAAINDSAWIVGSYSDSAGVFHGFLLIGKKYTTLNVPGAIGSYGLGINNKNEATLTWNSGTAFESSLYNIKTKKYKTINYPNSQSNAVGINDAGDVVYDWYNGSWHGGLWLKRTGKFYGFDVPRAAYTGPGGINSKREITGLYGAKSNGPYSGFTATYK